MLATAGAHDFQLDLTKFSRFQLFLEALLGLTAEQQQEIIIEEFFEDILSVFTTCIEFTKIFSCIAYGDFGKNQSRKTKRNSLKAVDVEVIGAISGADVGNDAVVNDGSSSGNVTATISSTSKDNVPINPANNPNNVQEGSQELLSELVSEALSVGFLCCSICLSDTSSTSIREKQGGDVARRKILEDKIIVRCVYEKLFLSILWHNTGNANSILTRDIVIFDRSINVFKKEIVK